MISSYADGKCIYFFLLQVTEGSRDWESTLHGQQFRYETSISEKST